MPKPQCDPSVRRLRQLLHGQPTTFIEWNGVTPSALDDGILAGIDHIRDLVDGSKALVEEARSACEGAVLDQQLEQVGREIGATLRELNRTGVFVSADRTAMETFVLEDPHSGDRYPAQGPVLRLCVMQAG